jgi:phenylpropionate dioxygenase-like ring-hydroxylating dioxygenase large terminal subunit
MTVLPILGPDTRTVTYHTRALLNADPFPDTISKESYISKEYMELENAKLWPRVWQLACREQQVMRPGDWYKYDFADQSILIVRTQNGEIKGLFNTCLHRGSPLKTESSGTSRDLRCRYHGWRWNLDGTKKEVTDEEDFTPSCVTGEKLKLPEVKVDTWGGFVFINKDPNCGSLLDFLGAIVPAMEHYELDKRKILRHRTTILPCNWKTAMNAFMDGYHIQGTHPQALEMYDDTGMTYDTEGLHAYHIQPRGTESRPSPRVGENKPTKREMLAASLAAREGLDLMSQEALQRIKTMADEMPEDMSPPKFIADKIRADRHGDEAYLDKFHDGQFGLENNPIWHIFPNVTTPQNAIVSFYLRFRPYELEPEKCLFDVWTMERLKPGEEMGPAPKTEFFNDYRDHDGWGGVLLQDLDNVVKVQRGMHNCTFTHFTLGYQDIQIKHHDRVLRSYLMG